MSLSNVRCSMFDVMDSRFIMMNNHQRGASMMIFEKLFLRHNLWTGISIFWPNLENWFWLKKFCCSVRMLFAAWGKCQFETQRRQRHLNIFTARKHLHRRKAFSYPSNVRTAETKEKFRISIIYDVPAAEVVNGIELIFSMSSSSFTLLRQVCGSYSKHVISVWRECDRLLVCADCRLSGEFREWVEATVYEKDGDGGDSSDKRYQLNLTLVAMGWQH